MTYDYSRAVRLADRLITRFGRSVSLIKPTVTLAQPSRPWKGPIVDEDFPETIDEFKAVVTTPNQVRIFQLSALGDASTFENLVRFSERLYILFPGEAIVPEYTHVLDEGVRYGITGTQVLRPGSLNVVAYLGARR